MKKVYTLVFAALCAAVVLSCNKEMLVETSADEQGTTPVAQTILNPVTLTFETPEPSKVVIDDQGVASWEEGDQVKIICFNANGEVWTSDPITVVEGKITATVEDADVYYAVYPAAATIALEKADDVDNLKVTVATKQDGTFKNACYYAARTTKAARAFNFKAVSGILKFQADPAYKKVDIRDAEKTTERHAFAETETCTFDAEGNVTVTPVPYTNSMISVALDGNGTYYAAICGNAVNEACFRFSKDAEDTPEEEKLGYEPGVFYNNLITYAPAKIKKFGKLTDKIVTDIYVSPEGAGTKDGLSAANAAPGSDLVEACIGNKDVSYTAVKGLLNYSGVWNCFRLDGLTIHFAAGEYTEAFEVKGNNSSFELTLQGEEGAVFKGGVTVSAARAANPEKGQKATWTNFKNISFSGYSGTADALKISEGKVNLENCIFSTNTTTKNGSALEIVMTELSQVIVKACQFTSNSASNGAAVCVTASKALSDDQVILSCEDCIFKSNTVTGSGGAILLSAGAKGGRVYFNNCRFDANTATGADSHAAALFCNNSTPATPAPMAFFNACSIYKNNKTVSSSKTDSFGYEIYCNTGGRLALNNCTVNTPNCNKAKNGCDITSIGQTIIVNTDIWGSGYTGQRALAFVGSKEAKNPATIVNCMIHHKTDDTHKYNTLFLTKDYYMNMSYSIYAGFNQSSAVEGTNYNFTGCYNRGVVAGAAPAGATYLTNSQAAQCTVRGIKHEVYSYDFVEGTTYPGFTLATKDQVIAAVEANSTIGPAFSAWLKELGAYDVDIIGQPRVKMYPGSYCNTKN